MFLFVALTKHVTHYGQRSEFPYYNVTIPHQEDTPYLPPTDTLSAEQLCFAVLSPLLFTSTQ
jgi:hypothetical protein